MATYAEAPALPRAPTVLRTQSGLTSSSSLLRQPQPPLPPRPVSPLDPRTSVHRVSPAPPPPPRFPSLTDVGLNQDPDDLNHAHRESSPVDIIEDHPHLHENTAWIDRDQKSLIQPATAFSTSSQSRNNPASQSPRAGHRERRHSLQSSLLHHGTASPVLSSWAPTDIKSNIDAAHSVVDSSFDETRKKKHPVLATSSAVSGTDLWSAKESPAAISFNDSIQSSLRDGHRVPVSIPAAAPVARDMSTARGNHLTTENKNEERAAVEASESFLQRILAFCKPREKSFAELEAEARAKAEAKPALVKAKDAICKLPDPTLLFIIFIILLLLVHEIRPTALKTWIARVLVPLAVVPTVVASTLWRRTRVISLKPDEKILSAAAPFPNAGLLVTKGEKLRLREAALAKAEDDLRAGQMKLEVMRKEVESRLPPHVDVNMDSSTGDVSRQSSYRAEPTSVAPNMD